jgi:hypothetical protein
VEVFCDCYAKPFIVSPAEYGAHEACVCSERCEADADMALALEMLRDRQ